jgi:hypothetical protein
LYPSWLFGNPIYIINYYFDCFDTPEMDVTSA